MNNTCIKCLDEDKCIEAKEGYYVNNGEVFRCDNTCC